MTQKRRFFTTIFTELIIFVGSRWNISTNEPVLERLLNLWVFGSNLMKIPYPVQAKERLKVKNFEIEVARKLDLIEPNWVYSYSSFIRLYQTRIVILMLVSMFFNLLDRVSNACGEILRIIKVSENYTILMIFYYNTIRIKPNYQ